MTTVAAAKAAIELTPQGVAYCLAHGREATERRIERHLAIVTALLALIDSADPDPDLEPGEDDEPSIGGTAPWGQQVDLELDDADREPSLGWTEMEARYGCRPTFEVDLELEEGNDEPSLGSVNPQTGGFIEPLGFWQVKPRWMSDDAWAGDPRDRQSTTHLTHCQTLWSTGRNDDREDEHDGAEPENEDGHGWAEEIGVDGGLQAGGFNDDDEVDDEGEDLEHYGESDGLEHGEADPAETDSGLMIAGGSEMVAL